MALGGGGDGVDWFFITMALARKGDRAGAGPWFDRASAWVDRCNALDGELNRLCDEAAALLGRGPPPGADRPRAVPDLSPS
jgi:hypothetical protein